MEIDPMKLLATQSQHRELFFSKLLGAMRSPAIASLAPLTRRRAIDYVRCASCFCS
jgi:hypothetical protein